LIDVQARIRNYLLADVALVALVGARIYAGRAEPPPGYKPGDGAALVFKVRGGGLDYEDALLIPSVQFKCYGEDEVSAWMCYCALHDALHDGRSAQILHAEAETLGQPLEEPQTEWRYVLAHFTIMMRT